jgi:serine/threonine protein kinase
MPSQDDTEGPVDSTAPTEEAGGHAGSMASLLDKVAATSDGGVLVPGTLVGGQYRIERAVGAGGMGVVHLAIDERLDRPVAIKLGAARSAPALARLQREAGALAKLSHPNVVTVYQVGEHDGRVFIAMEYVAEGTARSWAVAAPRSWREIIALYAAAGDGLAAAHAAGLVHRDFKPDNVLVGGDGRPRVADFGLARAVSVAVAGDAAPATDDARDVAVTRAGAVMGTPAYMPPEQLVGEDVDARADQFAFCASVWEALFGARPFDGSTPAEVKAAIESSPPATGEGGERRRRVPRHVLDALRRGLRPARDERWPAMAPLLAALRRDPAARRRRIALVLVGAAIAAAIAVPLALHAGQPPDPCTDGPTVLAETWNAARRARIAQTLGDQAWPAVQTRLEAYERAWLIGHRDACRATRVARSQSEDLLDRRMACLHRARIALGATLEVVERGGAAFGARATAALDALPGVDACADTAELAAAEPLPADPALRARVQEAITLVAQAQAATNEDMRPGMESLAERAVAAARAGGWKPQIAEALATRANALYDSGDLAGSVAL